MAFYYRLLKFLIIFALLTFGILFAIQNQMEIEVFLPFSEVPLLFRAYTMYLLTFSCGAFFAVIVLSLDNFKKSLEIRRLKRGQKPADSWADSESSKTSSTKESQIQHLDTETNAP